MSSISIDPLLGRLVAGKYEIRELLGVGAMGKVFRAHHVGLDKAVAIKVLIRMPGVEEAQARRFRAEARAASRLEHPNSVQILDFGEDPDGLQYIVMELLEGIDLQQLVAEQGPLPTARVAWIMSQVFSALSAAHRSDVIHRDVKPGNIMLVEKASEEGPIQDFVKVCDFGLAKILDVGSGETAPLTAKGAVFGTPAYMSPEQARGEPLDLRTDIYSSGVVMYKMITGHAPFRAESAPKVLLGHLHEEPPPLRSWGIEVDPGLEAVMLRAMAKDPADRYPSALEARDALRAVLAGLGHAPPATGRMTAPARPQSAVPTEQVRLRNDALDTQDTLLDTESATVHARGQSALDTRYAPTVPPPASRPEPPPTVATTASGGTAWWALVPGALALVAAAAPGRGARPAQGGAGRGRGRPRAGGPGADDARPRARDAGRGRAGCPSPSTPRGRASEAPPAAPDAPALEEPEVPTPAPPAPAPVAAMPAPRAPESPARPQPVVVTLARVEVQGAVSRTRCQDALARHLPKAQACLQPLVYAAGGAERGEVAVEADLDAQGRLVDMVARGLTGAQDCVREAFQAARLPRPDTGEVRVRFWLGYRSP
ncbi:MAG: serine/threonine protein kinase [Deltaproteobacteria bacterium]|nr:serine/threonine protein kinase [Deltaproteobacteria bacterium]